VWAGAVAAPLPQERLLLAETGTPIGCGGVAVLPGDLVVADGDGAVVVPAALADEITEVAEETERFDAWALAEIQRGIPLPGLYPPDAETFARYRASPR
jgi:regulator of RNase E activity RraA